MRKVRAKESIWRGEEGAEKKEPQRNGNTEWMNETSGVDNIVDRSRKIHLKSLLASYKCRHGFVTSFQFSCSAFFARFLSFRCCYFQSFFSALVSSSVEIVFRCTAHQEEKKHTKDKQKEFKAQKIKKNWREKKTTRNKLESIFCVFCYPISFLVNSFHDAFVLHSFDFRSLFCCCSPFKCQCVLVIGLTFIF